MKQVLLSLSVCLVGSLCQAQYVANDSITMGAGYANDVFYSFSGSTVKTVANNNWHLAFSAQASAFPNYPETGASIRVNGNSTGLMLKKLPSSQMASNWRSIDTAGLYKLPELINSDTSWDLGAFNTGYDKGVDPFNFGWGTYNQTTHNLDGASVFVLINSSAGIYKKIFVSKLNFDTAWEVITSNLDNTDSAYTKIRKKQYPNKLFVYYDVVNKTVVDREPIRTSWDVLFTRYKTVLPAGPGVFINYVVTGVLSNKGTTVAEIRGKKPQDVWGNISAPYNKNISEIGFDFKTSTPPLTILDSVTYFVKNASGTTYKLVFTKYQGSSGGKIWFFQGNKTGIKTVNVKPLELYPNPASDMLNVGVEAQSAQIIGLDGKVIIAGVNALNQTNVEQLSPGLYTIRVVTANGLYVGSFIKQ